MRRYCRALANDPPILIADEHTATSVRRCHDGLGIFATLVKKGKTVIMVSTIDDQAKQADRILHLSDGKVVGDSNHAHRKVTARSRKPSHEE